MTRMLALLALSLMTLSGCSHVISQTNRASVTPGLDLAMVRAAPQQHLGATLLLGGNILGLMPQEGRSVLEVYSWKLDGRGEPTEFDEAGGRFLVVTDLWFDPLRFRPGYFVTLVGTVEGSETVDLGGTDYLYPLIRVVEIHALELPLRYDGPPRINTDRPIPAPVWHERENPYDPTGFPPNRQPW